MTEQTSHAGIDDRPFPVPGSPEGRPGALPPGADDAPPTRPPGRAPWFARYRVLMRRYWPTILAIIAVSTLGTFVISTRMTPLYEATATIDLGPQRLAGFGGSESGRPASIEMDQFLATQMKLIQSDAVLRPVAEHYHLVSASGQPVVILKDGSRAADKAPIVLKHLSVTRPPNTSLLQVGFRHPDPQMAADVANAIANSYIEQSYHAGLTSWRNLSAFSQQQMDELKSRMEKSAAALQSYGRDSKPVGLGNESAAFAARLQQLSADYARAKSDRAAKEADYNAVKGGSLEAAAASPQGDLLRRLAERESESEQKYIDATVLYGENHPEYRRALAQMQEMKRLVEIARQGVVRHAQAAANEAKWKEQSLEKQLAAAKVNVDQVNHRSVEYQSLKRQADADRQVYEELLRKIGEAGVNAGLQTNDARVADLARPPLQPVSPVIWWNSLLAFCASLLFCTVGLVVFRSLDKKIRTAEDIQEVANVDVVGVLPAVKAWRTSDTMGLDAARPTAEMMGGRNQEEIADYDEEVRMLRGSVMDGSSSRRLGSIVIVSPNSGEGRSTVATNLAITQSELGRRTLLIDGDLRSPSLHRLVFAVTPALGLSNVLGGQLDWQQVVIRRSGRPLLHLLPAGPPTERISELIHSSLSALLAEVAGEYDVVIVDSPPLLHCAEALDMARAADGVLVVARAGKTRRDDLADALARLRRLHVRISGVALNDAG